MKFGSHLKSVAKAVSYRLMGATTTFTTTFLVTGKFTVAGGVVGLELMVKPFLYYSHERVWELSVLNRVFGTKGAAT